MLYSRVYEPKPDELLFHYCNGESFLSIFKSRKLRLSDLFAMNDFMELHWGYHIWELAAGELIKEVGKEFLDKIDDVIHSNGFNTLLVGSSLSTDGDVLSQWRAYSNDGKGYAIGFDAMVFANLPVRQLRVLYNKPEQINEAKAFIKAIHEVEQSQTEQFGSDFGRMCALFACDLASFKNPAFAEEKEVRIVHALALKRSNEFLKLHDEGGIAFGKKAKGQKVEFRMKGETPVAYLDIDFSNNGKLNPIKEVILGPKNHALPSGISIFMETLGLGNVTIRQSKASYR